MCDSQATSPSDSHRDEAAIERVVLGPLVMPWSYVFKQYVKASGDPWGGQVSVSSTTQASYGQPQS